MLSDWTITKTEGSSVWIEHPPILHVIPDGVKMRAKASHGKSNDWRNKYSFKTLSLKLISKNNEDLLAHGDSEGCPRFGSIPVQGWIATKDYTDVPGAFTGMHLHSQSSYYKRADPGYRTSNELPNGASAKMCEVAESAGNFVLANCPALWIEASIELAEREEARALRDYEETERRLEDAQAALKAALELRATA